MTTTNNSTPLEAMLEKYKGYLSNFEFYKKENKPWGKDKEALEDRIDDCKQTIRDLETLLKQPTPSKERVFTLEEMMAAYESAYSEVRHFYNSRDKYFKDKFGIDISNNQ